LNLTPFTEPQYVVVQRMLSRRRILPPFTTKYYILCISTYDV